MGQRARDKIFPRNQDSWVHKQQEVIISKGECYGRWTEKAAQADQKGIPNEEEERQVHSYQEAEKVMTIPAMVCLLLVCALFQPTHRRMYCAVVALGTGLHDVLLGSLGGEVYYLTAGATDLGILAVLFFLPATALGVQLIGMCIISMGLNLYGYIAWFTGQSPDAYHYAFIVFYAIVVLLFLGGDNVLGRHLRGRGRFGIFGYANRWACRVARKIEAEGY
jgi:hypothetical protein